MQGNGVAHNVQVRVAGSCLANTIAWVAVLLMLPSSIPGRSSSLFRPGLSGDFLFDVLIPIQFRLLRVTFKKFP